jgi:predicted nucleic acid-binding protein
MRIIIDTNILLSALISHSATRKVILEGTDKLYFPKPALRKIEKYKDLVLKKSGLDEESFHLVLSKLLARIELVNRSTYKENLARAKEIMSDIDPEDTTFVAMALSIPNSVIWSRDKHLQKQNEIEVVDTNDLRELRPEFIKKMKNIEKEEFVRYASVEEFKKEFE